MRLLLLVLLACSPARAEERSAWRTAAEGLKTSAELVLRDETFLRTGPVYEDAHRERWRLRLAAEAPLPSGFSAALRLGSGTGSQVSSFQSFGKLSSQKGLFVERLEAGWTGRAGPWKLAASAGKLQQPFWRSFSYELLYDPDYSPEGAAQSFERELGASGAKVFGHALEAVLEEDSGTARGRWLLAAQVGAETPIGQSSLKAALGWHRWTRMDQGAFGEPTLQLGNRHVGTSGVLANRFGILELQAEWKTAAAGLPLSLQGTLSRNLRARSDLAGGAARDAYEAGLIAGQAKRAGSWEAGAFRRWLEADSQVAALTDSEFGEGGTNRQGWLGWLAYAPADWSRLSAKVFWAKTLDPALPQGAPRSTRGQLDWTIRLE